MVSEADEINALNDMSKLNKLKKWSDAQYDEIGALFCLSSELSTSKFDGINWYMFKAAEIKDFSTCHF